jgi:hypothetical protein
VAQHGAVRRTKPGDLLRGEGEVDALCREEHGPGQPASERPDDDGVVLQLPSRRRDRGQVE